MIFLLPSFKVKTISIHYFVPGCYKIVDELTYQHLIYHISIALATQHDWNYSKISKVLGVDKERVRGWTKKSRGNPVAKSFFNQSIIDQELKRYINPNESIILKNIQSPKEVMLNQKELTRDKEISNLELNHNQKNESRKDINENISKEIDFNTDLEHELIYHLETIPTGVTSPRVLQSILIQHKNATLSEIENVLRLSNQIIRDKQTGKWILKRYYDEKNQEPTIEDELTKIDCTKSEDDEIIC